MSSCKLYCHYCVLFFNSKGFCKQKKIVDFMLGLPPKMFLKNMKKKKNPTSVSTNVITLTCKAELSTEAL